MRKSSKPLLLVALVVTAANGSIPLAGQDVPAASPGVRLVASAFTKAVEDTGIVGASLLVVRGGQVLTHETAGYQDLGDEDARDAGDDLPLGLDHQDVHRHRDHAAARSRTAALDDPIVKYVPELRLAHNPFGDISQVKIRHLMSHCGGLPRRDLAVGRRQALAPIRAHVVGAAGAMLPYTDVQFAPGSNYRYSNPGVDLPRTDH